MVHHLTHDWGSASVTMEHLVHLVHLVVRSIGHYEVDLRSSLRTKPSLRCRNEVRSVVEQRMGAIGIGPNWSKVVSNHLAITSSG